MFSQATAWVLARVRATAGVSGARGLVRPGRWGGSARRALVVGTLACAPAFAAAQNTTLVRETEFSYDPTTGQLLSETVDPGGPQCVETRYKHDVYGNRERVTVRPCASTAAASRFTPRVTVHEFEARAGQADGNNHPAGAYVTKTIVGTSDGSDNGAVTTLAATTMAYDTRFGAAIQTTQLALGEASGNRNLISRSEYDALGRPVSQWTMVNRAADTAAITWTRVDQKVERCAGVETPAAPCINFIINDLQLAYESKRLLNATGHALEASQPVTVRFVTAYYIESTPLDDSGAGVPVRIGARSRVHYDALHREFARETENYNGQWVRTLKGFDHLGLEAVSFRAHIVVATNTPPPTELRQWASLRDLMHRPLEAKQYVRTTEGAAASVVTSRMGYDGLVTKVTVPAPAGSGASERTRTTVKNAMGQVAQTQDAYGATLNSAYDGFGNLIETRDALNFSIRVEYTAGTARFKERQIDPDRGTWSYKYDALGQIVEQTDGNGKVVQMSYDAMGRMLTRNTNDLKVSWRYSVGNDGAIRCAAGLPATCESWTGNAPVAGHEPVTRRIHEFDALGRINKLTVRLDREYVSRQTFDTLGRPSEYTYPSGLRVKNTYSDGSGGKTPGFLVTVADATSAARRFWTIADADPLDAAGNLVRATLGNGVRTDHVLDSISGKPFRLQAGNLGSSNNVLDQRYTYDTVGNLVQRNAGFGSGPESFQYDLLDRLTRYTIEASPVWAANRSVELKYNALGNLLFKGDVGAYVYAGPRPHAVSWAAGTQYNYDNAGNLVSTTGTQQRTQSWTDFNLPATLAYNGRSVSFLYDERHQRIKETITTPGGQRQLWLVHPDNAGGLAFEREETYSNGTLVRNESRHYISAMGAVVAVVKVLNANVAGQMNTAATVPADASLTNYWHRDALGSIVAVTNGVGTVLERPAFDAWGRRLTNDRMPDFSSNGPAHGDRGYTGHEHLDEIGLVHMNGRVYDPVLARFLSPDPYTQAPDDLQNYNGYSYVLNRPLLLTDPSGEIWQVPMFIVGFVLAQEGNRHWQMVGNLMMMSSLGGEHGLLMTEAGMGAITSSAFAAGVSTAVMQGSTLQDTLNSALFAAAFSYVGGRPMSKPAAILSHMLIGCAQGMSNGSECGPSALAAGFGKWVSLEMPTNIDPVLGGALTMFSGGTASVIGGGKFSNGAMQAGFGYLFNALSNNLARKGYSELDSKYVVRYDKIPGTDSFEFTVYRVDREFLELAERVGAGGGAKLRDWEVGNFGPSGFKPKHGLQEMPDLPETALKKLGALMTDAAKARGMSIGQFVKGVPTFISNSGFKATMISWGVWEMYNDNLSYVKHCQIAPKDLVCQ
jgi:RHS repeat-associated protein